MKNILAIGAHPDDIELGCAGTLAVHKSKNDRIYFLVLTIGEAKGDPDIREKECLDSAKILNVDNIFLGRLQDTRVSDGRETIDIIENILTELKPDIIYAPSTKDTHQDHRNTGLAALSACRRSKKILLYEGASTLKEFSPQVFVDIEKTLGLKMKTAKSYDSQLNSDGSYYLAMNALEGLAKFRGYQVGINVAEAFEVGKYVMEP